MYSFQDKDRRTASTTIQRMVGDGFCYDNQITFYYPITYIPFYVLVLRSHRDSVISVTLCDFIDLDLLDMMKTKALLANFFMCTIAAASTGGAGDMELLLVQAIWRHGDRSPTKTFPKDPFQERNWTFGGGGFGQLSPLGMKQHMDLGKLIRKTYVDDMKFLSARYSSEEIYIRSTDTNRTIISAISNLLGMYGPNDGKAIPGIDYPAVEGWPPGLVPIAIHTVDDDTDYVANTDAYCYRREVLWAMAKNSSMLRAYQNVNAGLFANLTRLSGQFVTVDNFWVVRDALQIEQIHANETLRVVNTWFNDDLFKRMTTVQSQLDAYKNGVFNKTIIINGLDIGSEIQKLRGGSIFNEIMMHMNMKMKCLNVIHKGCKWMNGLKYYAYSA
ncbi:Intestinal acid phosphatase, partial [Trichostrongylus colubriformis]